MTTLNDFGGGVSDDETEVEIDERATPGSRCEALVGTGDGAGVAVERCHNDAGTSRSLCATHQDTATVVKVTSSPQKILRLAGRRAGQCRARKSSDGERCGYSTSATEPTCSIHKSVSESDYAEVAAGCLDQLLIAEAIEAVEAGGA